MTECNRSSILFSSHGRRSVEARFDGGSLTSDAGALLLREADRRLGLTAELDVVIPDPRNQDLIVHQQLTMLRQRIYGIALGNEDLNDHQGLREDPLMQLATERGIREDLPLASPPTLCRLENRITRPVLVAMAKVLVENFIASYATPPAELILDFDATDDPIHGNQVGRFFHGYYDQYCFLPLYVFCGDRLLTAYLRPANIDAAKHAWAILSLLVKRFRQVWPNVKIIFRGDSGFCRWRMLRWCDRHDVKYIVGLAKNSRLLKLAGPLMQQAQQQFEQTKQKQRLFGELTYAADTWDEERRVIPVACTGSPSARSPLAAPGGCTAGNPSAARACRRTSPSPAPPAGGSGPDTTSPTDAVHRPAPCPRHKSSPSRSTGRNPPRSPGPPDPPSRTAPRPLA